MKTRIFFEIELRKSIHSLESFLEDLRQLKEAPDETQIWFRGHSDRTYKLMPTAGRSYSYGGNEIPFFPAQIEQRLLHRFRLRAFPHVGRILNEWEALVLARHYLLPTRIMDWTASPLAALYFACENDLDKDGVLWAFARLRSQETDWNMLKMISGPKSREGPFELFSVGSSTKGKPGFTDDGIKILHPHFNSPRLSAQSGVFTFHSNPRMSLEGYAGFKFRKDRLDIRRVFMWNIPKINKCDFLRSLADVAVSKRTLFPDLGGLAEGLWEMSVLRNEMADFLPKMGFKVHV